MSVSRLAVDAQLPRDQAKELYQNLFPMLNQHVPWPSCVQEFGNSMEFEIKFPEYGIGVQNLGGKVQSGRVGNPVAVLQLIAGLAVLAVRGRGSEGEERLSLVRLLLRNCSSSGPVPPRNVVIRLYLLYNFPQCAYF